MHFVITREKQLNTSDNKSEAKLEKAIQAFRKTLYKKTEATIKEKGGFARVKNEASKIANLLIEVTNQHKLPIDLSCICEKMLIHTILKDQPLSSFSAELIPDERGFILKLGKMDNKARKRATIAHEIGHTLFYDTKRLPPFRILRYRPHASHLDKEEWIAWDFARELLLPKALFIKELASTMYSASTSGIVRLARAFEVSVELFCRRAILDLNFWDPCTLFICDIEAERLCIGSAKIYRTKSFPKFSLKGPKGLLNVSSELKEIIKRTCDARSKSDSGFIEFEGIPLWIQLLRYSGYPQRILGLLELPPIEL